MKNLLFVPFVLHSIHRGMLPSGLLVMINVKSITKLCNWANMYDVMDQSVLCDACGKKGGDRGVTSVNKHFPRSLKCWFFSFPLSHIFLLPWSMLSYLVSDDQTGCLCWGHLFWYVIRRALKIVLIDMRNSAKSLENRFKRLGKFFNVFTADKKIFL